MAVVITYSGSGIINLATGAIAMVAAYAFWALKTDYFGFTLATVPAVVSRSWCRFCVGVLSELLVFRPLRTSSPLAKLVASLGILLILQATVLLWFGSASKQIPSIFPKDIVDVFGKSIPANRFWMAGIVLLIALVAHRSVPVDPVRPGDARSRGERGVRHARRPVAEPAVDGQHRAGVGTWQAPWASSPPRSPRPTRARWCSSSCRHWRPHCSPGFTSLGIACLAGFGVGIGQSLMSYISTLSWFPTDRRQPAARRPGAAHLRAARARAVAARRHACRSRGELVEKRLPSAPRPQRLARPAVLLAVVGVVLLIVLPFGYRQALMLSLVGMVVCLSLVVITGFVGQVSLAQVTLAGVSGFVVSHMFVNAGIGFPWGPLLGSVAGVVVGLIVGVSALRVRGASLAVVTLAGVIAIEQFGFANSTVGRRPQRAPRLASRACSGASIGGNADVPRCRRQAPQPGARLRVPRRRDRVVPARRQPAPRRARPADAGGARQRAGSRGGGHQRRPRQDHRLRDLVVHRRHGGVDVRLQLRFGERGPVRNPDRARDSSPSPTSAGSRWSRAR